jgi:acid stress chaperone HdeB
MKIRFILLAIALAVLPLPSQAQIKVDMNNMTWLRYTPEQKTFVRYWMSGYYSAAANMPVLNYKRFQANSAKLAAFCGMNICRAARLLAAEIVRRHSQHDKAVLAIPRP